MKVVIKPAENGFVVERHDPAEDPYNRVTINVCQDASCSDSDCDAESVRSLLYTVMESLGITFSKHSERRVFLVIGPGDAFPSDIFSGKDAPENLHAEYFDNLTPNKVGDTHPSASCSPDDSPLSPRRTVNGEPGTGGISSPHSPIVPCHSKPISVKIKAKRKKGSKPLTKRKKWGVKK